MPTANSYMDKIDGHNTSEKAYKTIDRQIEREIKLKQRRSPEKEPLSDECDWRTLSLKETTY